MSLGSEKTAAPKKTTGNQTGAATGAQTGATDGNGQQFNTGLNNGFQGFGDNQQKDNGMSWADLARGGYGPISRNPTAAVLIEIESKIKEMIEKVKIPFTLETFSIDKANRGDITVSALVVVVKDTTASNSPLAYFSILAEGSIELERAIWQSYGNGPAIEIQKFASDAYDQYFRQAVYEEVTRVYGQNTFVCADAMVIPADFDVNDNNAIWSLTAQAASACRFALSKAMGRDSGFNLEKMSKSEQLSVKPLYHQKDELDAAGLPIRSSIVVLTSGQTGNRQQNQYNNNGYYQANTQNQSNQFDVMRVSAYLDFNHDPVQGGANMFVPQNNMMNHGTQLVTPELVVTAVNANLGVGVAETVFGIATMMAVTDNQAFFRQAYNKHQSVADDWDNIGGLGILAGRGIIDTKSDTYTPETLAQVIAAYVNPQFTLALDVMECGADTYKLGLFAAAAEGDQASNESILTQTDLMFGGKFREVYRTLNGSGRVLHDSNNRFHAGYFVHNGVKKDLRTIGYLPIINLTGATDLTTVREWVDSILNTNKSREQRTADRYKILKTLLGDSVHVVGMYRRCKVEPAFTAAVIQCIKNVGIQVTQQNQYDGNISYQSPTMSSVMPGWSNNINSVASFQSNFGGGQGNQWNNYSTMSARF